MTPAVTCRGRKMSSPTPREHKLPPPPLCCFLLSATQMNRCGAEEPEVAPEAPPSGFRTPIWRVAAFSKKCQSRSIFKEISKKRLSEAFGTLVDFDTRESSPNCRKCRAFPRSLFELTPWLLPTWTQIACRKAFVPLRDRPRCRTMTTMGSMEAFAWLEPHDTATLDERHRRDHRHRC